MILVDVNLLLYATDGDSPHHAKAHRWLREVLSRPEPIRLSWAAVLGFLRIATDARVQARPLQIAQAAAIMDEWLALPNVEILAPGERHWKILLEQLGRAQVRGPLVMDAHLAALAIEHGAILATADKDFLRFPGLRVEYPLEA
jgi:toxin-antitoxin system PIN domain toxin